jgi:hypothetical protein
MMRWEVTLRLYHTFSDTELNYWLKLFDSPACRFTREEDGGYCLTAERFEKLTDYTEVAESARKLVTMMAAIAKMKSDTDFQRKEPNNDNQVIGSIREYFGDGDKYNLVVFGETITATCEVCGGTVIIRDKDGNIVPQAPQVDWYDDYLNRCDVWINNPVIFKALDCFAEKTTPRTLRLVYEIVRDDEGGKEALLKNNNWVTRNELSAYTRSINHPDMEGEALHVRNPASKNHYIPMKLNETRKFLAERLLKPWLIKKKEFNHIK